MPLPGALPQGCVDEADTKCVEALYLPRCSAVLLGSVLITQCEEADNHLVTDVPRCKTYSALLAYCALDSLDHTTYFSPTQPIQRIASRQERYTIRQCYHIRVRACYAIPLVKR